MINDLIQSDLKLPSPPAIAVRILEAIDKDESSFDELGRIISADPALSTRVLQVANSPIYALPSKAESIQRAMAVLGCNALKNIALSFVIANEMRADAQGDFDFDYFWKRSVTAAVGADLIASLVQKKSDDLFVTALLQDIGIVVMYLCRPADYLQVLEDKQTTDATLTAVETAIFGFDHQDVGRHVLEQWGLPPTIYEPIGYHHADTKRLLASTEHADILMLSDKLSAIYHGHHSAEKINALKGILEAHYHVEESKIEAMIDTAAERSVETMAFFDIDPGQIQPFSQMLQEANAELGKLNLSYEYLVIELKQAKATADKLAHDLQAANAKLRGMAFRDGLTGLYNHRYFQECMDKEISQAMRYQRPLALIMMDLDHFKRINDDHGHPAGDAVLETISATIQQTVRRSDTVCRYGGEEFSIVLPETTLKGAVILAERLRKIVDQLVIPVNQVDIHTTVSVGLTTWEPGSATTNKDAIIDAADRALYKSKNNGRNKVSFAPTALPSQQAP